MTTKELKKKRNMQIELLHTSTAYDQQDCLMSLWDSLCTVERSPIHRPERDLAGCVLDDIVSFLNNRTKPIKL